MKKNSIHDTSKVHEAWEARFVDEVLDAIGDLREAGATEDMALQLILSEFEKSPVPRSVLEDLCKIAYS